jgi:restriction system protein
MGRRKTTILDDLMVLTWWFSPVAALIAYVGIGYVLPAIVPQDHPAFAAFSMVMPKIAPIVGFVLLVPMPFAYLNGRKKQRLVDSNRDLESIRALSWKEFEQLVAEAFRRKGYIVRENLTGGPDGGVDVELEKDGQSHLVQCKQWKVRKVGVSIVREMYGVMTARNASSVSIVSSGIFTQEVQNFAEDKPIDLIDGVQLTKLISGVQRSGSGARVDTNIQVKSQPPLACPRCGGELVTRAARRGSNAGKQFIGCSGYPKCKYTQNL